MIIEMDRAVSNLKAVESRLLARLYYTIKAYCFYIGEPCPAWYLEPERVSHAVFTGLCDPYPENMEAALASYLGYLLAHGFVREEAGGYVDQKEIISAAKSKQAIRKEFDDMFHVAIIPERCALPRKPITITPQVRKALEKGKVATKYPHIPGGCKSPMSLSISKNGFYFYCVTCANLKKDREREKPIPLSESTEAVYPFLYRVLLEQGLEVYRHAVTCPSCSVQGEFLGVSPHMVYVLHTPELVASRWVDYTGVSLNDFPGLALTLYRMHPDRLGYFGPKKENDSPVDWVNTCRECGARLQEPEGFVKTLVDAAGKSELDRYRTGEHIDINRRMVPENQFKSVSDAKANSQMWKFETTMLGVLNEDIYWWGFHLTKERR